MVPDALPVAALVIILVCLAYFVMAFIPFLFVRLDIPEVSRLFRGLFDTYFRMAGGIGFVAMIIFALSGRMAIAGGMLLFAAAAISVRKGVLQRIDTQQSAFQSGDIAAMRRLRLIHWGGMLANVVVIATVVSSIPFN